MEEGLTSITQSTMRQFTHWSQVLASFYLTPEILKKDLAHHHSTATPQSFEDLSYTLLIYAVSTFLAVTLADVFVCRPLTFLLMKIFGVQGKTTRYSWYLLHAMFNTLITLISLEDAYKVAVRPHTESWLPASWYGSYPTGLVGAIAIGAFHVQHFCFFPVTKEEIIHHCVNAGAVVLVGVYCPWGKTTALSNIVMCGIPGGVNYYVLWLQKSTNLVPNAVQKVINRAMHIGLRLPIQLIAMYLLTLGLVAGTIATPVMSTGIRVTMIVGAAIHTLNAFYYADQVVGNYHVYFTEKSGKRPKTD
eukprot:PhF_6_TR1480/c0_g1_i1/m.2663